jgi:hypothetical protein
VLIRVKAMVEPDCCDTPVTGPDFIPALDLERIVDVVAANLAHRRYPR